MKTAGRIAQEEKRFQERFKASGIVLVLDDVARAMVEGRTVDAWEGLKVAQAHAATLSSLLERAP